MDFEDYVDGTAYIVLLPSDFKSEYRFKQFARFMKQNEREGAVEIPIDSDRARELSRVLNNRRADE